MPNDLALLQELEDAISASKRTERRDNVSVEYLKNIFMKFMDAPPTQEHHLAKAIAAILQLSPSEAERVLVRFKGPRKAAYAW